MRMIDKDRILTKREKEKVIKAREEYKSGKTKTLADLKKELNL